ncbi:MAG: hypothetical protein AAFQ58_19065 [Pseudomonadota bacterium]
MTENPTTIEIRTNPKFRLGRSLYSLTTVFAVLGSGIIAESNAMQWAGFVLLAVLAIALSATTAKRNSSLTIEEARKLLDEIEAREI